MVASSWCALTRGNSLPAHGNAMGHGFPKKIRPQEQPSLAGPFQMVASSWCALTGLFISSRSNPWRCHGLREVCPCGAKMQRSAAHFDAPEGQFSSSPWQRHGKNRPPKRIRPAGAHQPAPSIPTGGVIMVRPYSNCVTRLGKSAIFLTKIEGEGEAFA